MCSNEERPSVTAVLTNLRKPLPLHEKVRLVIRNYGIRLFRLQTCCGHPGEPGC